MIGNYKDMEWDRIISKNLSHSVSVRGRDKKKSKYGVDRRTKRPSSLKFMADSGRPIKSDWNGQGFSVHDDEATVPIAIIGMSCRFLGDATSPEKLWELRTEVMSAWSEIPKDGFNQDAFYHPHGEKFSTSSPWIELPYTPTY